MLKIVSAPNPVLSQSAKQISKIDSKILKIIEEMKKTLLSAKDPIGVGLAAPQVGISLQIFIVKPTPKSKIRVFINPFITKTNTDQLESVKIKSSTKLEGCLSLSNIWGEVKRSPEIKLRYQISNSSKELITKNENFSGFMATIIQHEMDHLEGILFPKRVLEQKGTLYKSRKNAKGEDEFEEIEI